MHKLTRYQLEKMNRQLIDKYLNKFNASYDDKEYLRYLIDTIYDDTVGICGNCDNGLVLEVLNGDYAYGQCDNCHKKYRY